MNLKIVTLFIFSIGLTEAQTIQNQHTNDNKKKIRGYTNNLLSSSVQDETDSSINEYAMTGKSKYCGCTSCTEDVLNKMAGKRSCRDRIDSLQADKRYSEKKACKKIAGKKFPDICGPSCDPDRCNLSPTPVDTPNPTYVSSDPPSSVGQPSSSKSSCGCVSCTEDVLDRMAGEYSCRDRIDWLQEPAQGYSEDEACKKVAGKEFPGICGSSCDPDRCNLPPTPVTPNPTYESAPPSPLYCFPPEGSRVTFQNVWEKYTVQVKQDESPCGPGNNLFSTQAVVKNGNEVTLKFQKRNGRWEGSEVRVVIPNETYKYGNYKFHVKSVNVIDPSKGSISDVLPKDIVLGLFTWDDTERYDVHENYNHEVDIEIARWGSNNNADVQFLMQPPGSPQMYRFFSGPRNSYNQSDQWHSFEWLPSKISWQSTSGGGKSHEYTTEAAVKSGRRDYIQCLPAEMEVRMNLWNMHGAQVPDGMSDEQSIEVVIDDFEYEPATVSFLESGEYCSKHCQCEDSCINGRCGISKPVAPTNPPPTRPPTPTSNRGRCGCASCTEDVLDRMAGEYSCRDRIDWLQEPAQGYSEDEACKKVAGKEFPGICGSSCDPDRCNLPPTPVAPTNPTPTLPPTPTINRGRCGCASCTEDVLDRMAGEYSCRDRIDWLQEPAQGYSEDEACKKVAGKEFPGICGSSCDPDQCSKKSNF